MSSSPSSPCSGRGRGGGGRRLGRRRGAFRGRALGGGLLRGRRLGRRRLGRRDGRRLLHRRLDGAVGRGELAISRCTRAEHDGQGDHRREDERDPTTSTVPRHGRRVPMLAPGVEDPTRSVSDGDRPGSASSGPVRVADRPQAQALGRRQRRGPRPGRGRRGCRAARRRACGARPTSTSVPTTLRIIWWQKALASISKRSTPSPRSVQPARRTCADQRRLAAVAVLAAGGRTPRSRARRPAGRSPGAAGRGRAARRRATPCAARNGSGTGPVHDRVAVGAARRPSAGRRSRRGAGATSRTTIGGPAQAVERALQRQRVEPVGRRRRS